MKIVKFVCFSVLFITFLFLVSCGGGSNPAAPSHVHSFDSTTQKCECGVINEGVVAYIGSSYSSASARFLSLQDGVNYLYEKQHVQAKGVEDSNNIIHGYGQQIACTGLTINDTEVKFDFSDTNVTFSNSGITIDGGNVEIVGNTLNTGSIENFFDVKSGTVSMAIDFSGQIALGDGAVFEVKSGKINITGFAAEESSVITFELGSEISIANTEIAKLLNENVSEESSVEVEVEGHNHNPGDEIFGNSTSHWVCCTECGAKMNLQNHIWNQGEKIKDATCSDNEEWEYTCSACGKTETRKIANTFGGHKYSTDWKYDNTYHWQECDYCGDVVSEGVHQWDDGTIISQPQCLKEGVKEYICRICGAKRTETLVALQHDFTNAEYGYDEENHWQVCNHGCGMETAPRPHEVVTDAAVAPTCTTSGLTEGSHCKVCGKVMVAQTVIPALGHDYEDVVTSPTVNEGGYTTHTCKRCGYVLTDSYTSALGHSFSSTPVGWEWNTSFTTAKVTLKCETCETEQKDHTQKFDATVTSVTEPADCTNDGKITYTAKVTVNGVEFVDVKEKTLSALGHNYISKVTAPNCTEQGFTTHTCSRCGDVYIDTYTPIKHDLVHHSGKAATCTEIGWNAYDSCSLCEYTTYEKVPALGHDWGDVEYTWNYNHQCTAKRVCKNNTKHIETETVQGVYSLTKDSTCTEEGSCSYTASFSNAAFETQIKTQVIEKKEHVYNQSIQDERYLKIAATCTDPAVYYKSCICGESSKDYEESHELKVVDLFPEEIWTCQTSRDYCLYSCNFVANNYYGAEITIVADKLPWSKEIVIDASYCDAQVKYNHSVKVYSIEANPYFGHSSFYVNNEEMKISASGGNWTERLGNLTVKVPKLTELYFEGLPIGLGHKYENGVCTFCNKSVLQLEDSDYCSQLTGKLVIPRTITGNIAQLLEKAPQITQIELEEGFTTIESNAFYGCSGLTSITIPNSVKSIGYDAFYGCSGLTSITIPDSVTSIGYDAFYGCTGLTSITIPNSVTSIGSYAFKGCSFFTSITIPDSVKSIGSYAFYGCSGLTSITIPDSVTSIGDSAFYGCTGLTSITIPSSVTSIDKHAFEGCSGLTSITIPNSVTSIGSYAFNGCSGLTSITIPNSVTSISSYAFYGCRGLTSITIPNSVTSIGSSAFYVCSGLTSITIPDSVTSIGSSAFVGCRGLTSITIPNSVTSIGSSAFYGCSGLTSITIPDSVTSIGYKAFEGCSGLTSITIPDSVTSIGSSAFEGCSGLTSITIPDSVTSIESSAFKGCSGLTSITIPDGVTSIESSAFNGCSGLTSITIPNSVASISSYAFEGCSGLTSITIPSSVTSIGDSAFEGCSGLTSITIPDSVTSIGSSAFEGCSGLTSITIPDSVTSIGSNAFNGCSGLTSLTIPECITGIGFLIDGCTGLTSITIPDSVTSIKNYEFSGCSRLTSITIPDSVTSIGYKAFEGCSGLTSITIPVSVSSIDKYAFEGCSGLTSITIPSSVTSIGDSAFKGCSGLTSITIPDSVTSIGYDAFYGCTGLTSITIPNSVKSIGSYAFYGCSGLTSIIIPNSVTSIESNAFNGCSGLTSITIPNSVKSIGSYAFNGCSGLTSITIPSSVTSIGDSAFKGCSGLTSITIPDSVTSLGSAFNYCSGLTSITIPDSVTSIGYSAFGGCSGLTSITIPNSVTSIGSYAFYGCSGLTSITIPNSVTSIGSYAFYGCSGLTSITIPSSVTSIGDWVFKECTGLTSITIPDSVTSISDYAFYGCSSLRNITIPDSVTSIGEVAFRGCKWLREITIPSSVTSIGYQAFGNSAIQHITIDAPKDSITGSPWGADDAEIIWGEE